MAEKINISEALSIAKQMLNHYRAFEKLKEVIEVVLQSEQTISENIVKRDAILKEISELNLQKQAIVSEIDKLESKELKIGNDILALSKSGDDEKRKILSDIESLKGTLAKLEKQNVQKISDLKREHDKVLIGFAEEEAQARERLKAVKNETKSLLEKFQ